LEKANTQDIIYMRDPDGLTLELKQIEPTESRLTLGVWQSLDGNETKMKEDEMIKKGKLKMGH
jgi:hypothetical protein